MAKLRFFTEDLMAEESRPTVESAVVPGVGEWVMLPEDDSVGYQVTRVMHDYSKAPAEILVFLGEQRDLH